MNKVVVIGCPGSGKTYFSKRLSEITGLPLIHLDRLYHDKRLPTEAHKKRPIWLNEVSKLVKGEKWVIDGNYKSTFDIRLSAADIVIIFNYPRYLVLYRLLKRRIMYHNTLRADMPIGWQEKIDRTFFKFVWNFKEDDYPNMKAKVSEYSKGREVILFNSPVETERFLNSMQVMK